MPGWRVNCSIATMNDRHTRWFLHRGGVYILGKLAALIRRSEAWALDHLATFPSKGASRVDMGWIKVIGMRGKNSFH
jgi:hypothetical protein